jgi:microcystin-dependent protein
MSEPFVGQIALFAFNFAPVGWLPCNGQLLSISNYTALFSLIGTYYGGNGTTNFALPDLQGRAPINQGNGAGLPPYVIGESTGSVNATVTISNLPAHTHLITADSTAGTVQSPSNNYLAAAVERTAAVNAYTTAPATPVTLNPKAVQTVGGSLPIEIVQPILVMNYCIATVGIFPSRG